VSDYPPPSIQPPAAPRPRRANTGRTVVLVLLAVVFVVCCLPVGGYAAHYLTSETGPHDRLPDTCEVVTDDALRDFVGGAAGHHERRDGGGTPKDSCRWASDELRHAVTITTYRYTRSWKDSSVDEARTGYRIDAFLARGGQDLSNSVPLPVADDGTCVVQRGDELQVEFECVVRAGNVVIDMEVKPALGSSKSLSDPKVIDSVKEFAAGLGRVLMEDVIEDL
jgi:hypothetical protein